MSLFLRAAIGAGLYLLDAARVLEIREVREEGNSTVRWHGDAVEIVDLRQLFAAGDSASGCLVLYTQTSGVAAALLVDRVDGVVELGDAQFSPLPPIGPVGSLIDAVARGQPGVRPALRLRGERALAVAAAMGRG